MKMMLEEFSERPMVYMRRMGAYGAENDRLMARFKAWASERGLLAGSTIYGIVHDGPGTPPVQCRYDVALVTADEIPAEEAVQPGVIAGGRYAVWTLPHTAEAVQAFWDQVFDLLGEQGLELDASRPILERYEERAVQSGWCAMCVPIK